MSKTLRTLGLLAVVLLVSPVMAGSAIASDGSDQGDVWEASPKEQWQSEYRRLLQEAARLERNAEAARENYAQAQQRNYPRGGARQKLLIDEHEARQALKEVEAEIERFKTESRHDGVLPGWYYEVEEEPMVAAPQPAAESAEDAEDRDGRNPLYLDQE